MSIVHMELKDYVKCTKRIHELIRRTGVDHKLVVLNE